MELESKIQQLGATDLLTLTQTLNELASQHEDAKLSAWRLRLPNTEYKAGDKVIVPGVGNFDKVLRCESAGTTADTAFPAVYDDISVGDIVQDGTVAWSVVNLFTMPDIAGAPVTSVNGKTGDVNLTAQHVGADPAGTANTAVSAHNTATDAHKTLFDNHRAEKASTSASGHVKVDGDTIVSENGTVKSPKIKELATQMQQRMLLDMSNGTRALQLSVDNVMPVEMDYIVEHGEGAGEAGGVLAWWWYDKYRSGKVVQGGKTALQTKAGYYTINLPIEMDSANYIVSLAYDGEAGALITGGTYDATTASNITATSFDTYLRITNNLKYKFWRVEGKATTE